MTSPRRTESNGAALREPVESPQYLSVGMGGIVLENSLLGNDRAILPAGLRCSRRLLSLLNSTIKRCTEGPNGGADADGDIYICSGRPS